jgi:hypothetical protein
LDLGAELSGIFCLALALLGNFCALSAKNFALWPPKAQALKTSGAQHFWWAEAPKSTPINNQTTNNKQCGTMAAEG